MKEKFKKKKLKTKNKIALGVRPNRTITTIKSKDSHCDSKDQSLIIAIYRRYI